MLSILAGFAAGAGHVLAGPDHLGAVGPLAARSPQNAWKSGLRWGLGHTAGVLIVGVLFLALREVLPIDLISGWSERLVGVVLIAIGAWGLRTALGRRLHVHEHRHGTEHHAHVHVHDPKTAHRPADAKPPPARPCGVRGRHAARTRGQFAPAGRDSGVRLPQQRPGARLPHRVWRGHGRRPWCASRPSSAWSRAGRRGRAWPPTASFSRVCSCAAVGIGLYWVAV